MALARITFGRNPDESASLPLFLTAHEIGHALGLIGFPPDEELPWYDPLQGRFTGALALEGYRRVFGLAQPFLPVRSGHWDFIGDVMGAENSANISAVSVGALMDTGYPAAWYGADR